MQIPESDPFEEINSARKVLADDMRRAWKEMLRSEPEDVQFWRRTLVRAVFAQVEVVLHFLRHAAFRACEITGVELTDAERFMLQERNFAIDSKGRAQERTYFAGIERSTRFALACFVKAHKIDPVNYSDRGWEVFKQSIEVRNRITHSRHIGDVELSKKEAYRAMLAGFWLSTVFGALIDLGFERIQSQDLDGCVGAGQFLYTSV